TVDDLAVRQAMHARRGVDARDPQRAEFALLRPPVAEGILPRLDDGLLGGAVHLAPRVVVALGLAEDFLVTAARLDATFDSCHEICAPRAGLLVVGQKLRHAADIALVDEARAART